MRLARRAAVILIALLAVGCQTTHDQSPHSRKTGFPNWPEALQDFRFRWSADPGIDLGLGPAVPLRAYLESHRVGDYTLDPNTTYPGFHRAVPKGPSNDDPAPTEPYQLWFIEPYTDPNLGFGPARFYGNENFHILELTPIDTGYRAYVCDGLYKAFRESEHNGKYVPVIGRGEIHSDYHQLETSAMRVWRVEFTDHPTPPDPKAPAAVTVPQKGPNPAPLGDVFGPWHITGASDGLWGPRNNGTEDYPSDPAVKQREQQCFDRMPDDAAARKAFLTSQRDTPPPAQPAVPGWPDNAV